MPWLTRKTPAWAALLLLLLTRCVQPYDPGVAGDSEVLVVDAVVTDQPDPQPVKLSRSLVQNGKVFSQPVRGAAVELLVNGTPLTLAETDPDYPGWYPLPADFRGKPNERYQLRFRLADGRRYESTVEMLAPVPPIARVYDKFDARGIVNTEKTVFTPAHLIYVDTQDPPGQPNRYRWSYTFWERQHWCDFYLGGLFVVSDSLTGAGACVPQRTPSRTIYDYQCRTTCWDVFQGAELNVFADQYGDGRPILGRLVGRVPYYEATGTLVELRQYGLSRGAYDYFRILDEQTQRTGGLADTPPAPITGNVRNVADEREVVLGYFSASAVSVVRYWLDRRGATTAPIGLFQATYARVPNPEPEGRMAPPYGIRPPTVRCVPGPTRTPVAPVGWRQ